MPASAAVSRTSPTCSGRPSARFEPPATISSGCCSAAAQATTSAACWGVSGLKDPIAGSSRSEPGQVGEADLTGVYMHPAELGAAVQLREHLAGIEKVVGVEGALETLLLREVDVVEHRVHQVTLLDADAVLAGQHATDLNAETQD